MNINGFTPVCCSPQRRASLSPLISCAVGCDSYEWCLDYKQMIKHCRTSTGSREWTKEEMMAYLDWSEAEDKRIEAQVVARWEIITLLEVGEEAWMISGDKQRGILRRKKNYMQLKGTTVMYYN